MIETNVAFNQDVKQISDYEEVGVIFKANLAVDGNFDRSGKSCAHTKKTNNSWLSVDMLAPKYVKKVILTNSADYCWSFKLFLNHPSGRYA